MAVSQLVRRVAAGAAAPTFVIGGATSCDLDVLLLDRRIHAVASPRHATVLLVAGILPEALVRPAGLVHDTLPHPRATVWWGDGDPGVDWLRECSTVSVAQDPAAMIAAVHGDLMGGNRRSEPAIVGETNRSPWQGVGPYGHGGSGMTGGEPYGRPLTEREDDPRDGLALDVLPVTVGPFFPGLPAGFTIDVALHGDILGAVEVREDPFLDSRMPHASPTGLLFEEARAEPVAVATLERGRVSHHLRAVSRTLRLHGLHALAARVLAVAVAPRWSDQEILRLLRTVERTGLARVGAGVGVVPTERAVDRALGLAARASGVPEDAREADAAYAHLGFRPVTQAGGDARARLRQRVAEIRQSLRLVEQADGRMREPGPQVEDPRLPAATVSEIVEEVLLGMEWGDAVTTIDSFDIVMGLPKNSGVVAEAA